jgi:hypothetical protein
MGGGLSPDYGSEPLLSALANFVVALGQKYDGDNRIAFIHLGLLGFWYAISVSLSSCFNATSWLICRGEWHTFPLTGLVPDHAKTRIVDVFRNSFKSTKLQARYPDRIFQGFGYYDGSFAFSTLVGSRYIAVAGPSILTGIF